MPIGSIIALAVGILLAVLIVIGHATLQIVAWALVVLCVAILLGGKAAT